MGKSVFVSHVHEDNKYIKKLENWTTNDKLGKVQITKETQDKRGEGSVAIKKHIQKKIEGAAVVLVLVGDDTHNHDWIKAEVELANNYNKKIVCARIPNTKGKKPEILKKYKELDWNAEQLKKAIHGKQL